MRFLMMSFFCLCFSAPATAEVTASSPDHYTLSHEGTSSLAPDELWARLINPAEWWHPDHTYSGDAGNLSLKAKAGGQWREVWDEGSTSHGVVLLVEDEKTLRLNAPFGPLQGMGVTVVWTISLTPNDETGGTNVTFTEVANGSAVSKLDAIAPAVDFVKTEAMRRLITKP